MLLYLFRYSNTALLVGVYVCVCVFCASCRGNFWGAGVVVSIHLLAQICINIYLFVIAVISSFL